MTERDVTPEAVTPLFEKSIDGFASIFHLISYNLIGASTIQSRTCAGLASGTLVFVLPGSPSACRDAWDHIIRTQLDAKHKPCNFVALIDRFEHRKA